MFHSWTDAVSAERSVSAATPVFAPLWPITGSAHAELQVTVVASCDQTLSQSLHEGIWGV